MLKRFSAIALSLFVVFACRAQPLADHLPADTILYVGWSGTDSLGPGYDDSHLKAVLDSSNVRELINDFIPALANKIAQDDPQAAQVLPMVGAIVGPLWKYPTALYFGGIEMGQQGPMPKLALLIDAKQQADAVMQGLANPLAMAQQSGVPIEGKVVNGVVVISVGAIGNDLQATLNAPGAKSLMQEDAFKTTMGQLTPSPVAAGYLSFTKLLAGVDHALGTLAPQLSATWNMAKTNLALDGIKSAAFASGFDGKNWGVSSVIWAPAPRAGFAANLQTEPLSEDVFKLTPKPATFMAAFEFDLGKLVQGLRALAQFKPEIATQIDQAVQQVNGMLGFDVQKDLLDVFGPQWLCYTNPEAGGNGLVGTVLVNRAADAAKLEQSLSKIEQMANTLIAQNTHDPKVHIEFVTKEVSGTTLHYFAIPLITPTWAIRDGNFYLGAYPQSVLAAATFGNTKGPSILDNEKFQAVRKHLGPEQVTSCTFIDLPALAPENYGPWVALSRMVGIGDVVGVRSPLFVMPPMKALMDNLEPTCEISWTDDFGFHFRGVSPFPGAEALADNAAGGIGGVYGTALMTSVMLPSLSRAREVANRAKSASNLKQIGEMCLLYANDHNGKMPSDLGELEANEDLFIGVFISPLTKETRAAPPAADKASMSAWVKENSDYVYNGAGKTAAQLTPNDVLAHEKMQDAIHHQGMNVLFGDGHVEWMALPRAQQALAGKE